MFLIESKNVLSIRNNVQILIAAYRLQKQYVTTIQFTTLTQYTETDIHGVCTANIMFNNIIDA